MSWHKMTLKVIDVLALLGLRCLGTHQLNGLRIAISQETSFKQEIGIYIVLLFILFFLPLPFVFKCLLFFANTLVLIVEIINSAIESVVDMTSPDFHELAGKGKDLGSAAVFISMILVIVLWLCAIYVMIGAR